MSGDAVGTSGVLRQTFLYAFSISVVIVAAVNILSVITRANEEPALGIAAPIVWEASSWFTFLLFFWIPWVAYRIAPPSVRPRWMLLIHLPADVLFAACHVTGFVLIRKAIYALGGYHYDFGRVLPHFLYELSKDSFGYVLGIAGFALIENLLRQRTLIATPGQTLTFDIRDGARLTRVRLDEVLAIASAGNYVEFVLSDGRRLMMRSPLSALETELSPRGFLRTHRSWLVNANQMTALKPEGSGDYEIELGAVKVPLSRRFPDALAKLRRN